MVVERALAGVMLVAVVASITFMAWPFRVQAKLKMLTKSSAISFAGGVDIAGISVSTAGIAGGPGVVAVHLRSRETWRRAIARLSVDAFFEWLDALVARPAAPKGALSRLFSRLKTALVARTDVSDLPELGLRVLLGLRETAFHGAITCGFADPARTGKTAAVLFPIAGILAPFGALDLDFDWSGRTVVDGELDVSFRVVPAKVAFEGLRFVWCHVHLLRQESARASASSNRLAMTTR
jgi:hypothetical protein